MYSTTAPQSTTTDLLSYVDYEPDDYEPYTPDYDEPGEELETDLIESLAVLATRGDIEIADLLDEYEDSKLPRHDYCEICGEDSEVAMVFNAKLDHPRLRYLDEISPNTTVAWSPLCSECAESWLFDRSCKNS